MVKNKGVLIVIKYKKFSEENFDVIIWYSPTIFWGPFIARAKKKFNANARKDKKINPFKEVLQKKEKFEIIVFSKIDPAK